MQTTEELKREMYRALANAKGRVEINYSIKDCLRGVDEFENALEDYLGKLHQELLSARQSIDDLQIRNHALSYAYSTLQVACRSSGDSLRDAQNLVRKQRQVIADLQMANTQAEPVTCQHAYRTICGHARCVFCMATMDQED